ncbi:MAG TPA: phosphatase PAP2 family protein, partial [Solirubrobacteraceae bacterium]|nr:phosphatase PAP2 family protein [Solirubrobacteraceae bacterium]
MSKHLKLRLRYGRARRRAGRREFAIFGAIYLLYDAARWAWAGHLSVAQAHARSVFALERSLHIAIEGSVQRALASGVTSFLLSNVYLAAQAVVLPAALIWLYRRSPGVYRQLRGTVVITWLIATPIFALYPVAPPRLSGIGIKDVVSHQAVVTLTGQSTLFYNPYAAVPSLHVGFSFAIGIAAAAALSRPWARALALLWGPLVTLAVVATGNHYLFDAGTGLLVASAAFAATRAVNSGRFNLQLVRRAAALRPFGASVPATEPLAPTARVAAGPAAGINADLLPSAPAAARPNHPT